MFLTNDCLSLFAHHSELQNQKGVMTFSELSIIPSFTSFLANSYSFEVCALYHGAHYSPSLPLPTDLLVTFIQMTFASTLAMTSTSDHLLDTNEQL